MALAAGLFVDRARVHRKLQMVSDRNAPRRAGGGLKKQARLDLEGPRGGVPTHNSSFECPTHGVSIEVCGRVGPSCRQEIVPGLHTTNFFGARNRAKLRAAGITHVVNCDAELDGCFAKAEAGLC